MPPLFIPHEEGEKPDYARGAPSSAAEQRAPLDVPPELRGSVEVPMPEKIAGQPQSARGASRNKAVAGTAVSLDARVYEQPVDMVFSAVVDAMTALNLPVQSVDSPSGTVTTEWIRHDVNSPNTFGASMGGIFGTENILASRHRFVVRVLRLKAEGGDRARLEIRTLGQVYKNRHWINKPIKRKVDNELFAAVEEQLARRAPTPGNTASETPGSAQ